LRSSTNGLPSRVNVRARRSSGAITPNEAAALSVLVGNVAKAVATFELAERMALLGAQMASKGGE
jgi:hypothetical protein